MRSLNFIMPFFEKRSNRAWSQVVFWICLLGAVNLLFLNIGVPGGFTHRNWLMIASVVFLIFWNVYFLVPRFFLQKRYGAYALSVSLSMIILVIIIVLLETQLRPEFPAGFRMRGPRRNPPFDSRSVFMHNPRYLFMLINYTAAIMAGTVFESIQLHRKQELIAAGIEREKLAAEMKFLKSQINPHFLFNALHNVYTLSLIRSEHTPEVVMKLSEMLRYMLYDSSQHRVPLCHEIRYINNFIAIQQLKDDAPLSLQTEIKINDQEARIAPMILIPFVENAFKHSKIEDTDLGWISIHLLLNQGQVQFKVTNSVAPADYTKDTTGGIGLQNVNRRLELEYPDHYQLQIQKTPTQFSIDLSIALS